MNALPKFEPYMPPDAPLARPIQDLRAPYHDATAPGLGRTRAWAWRLATFLPAFATTFGLVAAFTDWFVMGGLTGFELTLIALIAITFFWISLSVATVTVGLAQRAIRRAKPAPQPGPALDVALLVPIYNEVPWDVFGNACAMLEALDQRGPRHSFTLFILSDTRDEHVAEQELQAFATLRTRLPDWIQLHYRRRAMNTDRKVGNLADWVERWGGAHDASNNLPQPSTAPAWRKAWPLGPTAKAIIGATTQSSGPLPSHPARDYPKSER